MFNNKCCTTMLERLALRENNVTSSSVAMHKATDTTINTKYIKVEQAITKYWLIMHTTGVIINFSRHSFMEKPYETRLGCSMLNVS